MHQKLARLMFLLIALLVRAMAGDDSQRIIYPLAEVKVGPLELRGVTLPAAFRELSKRTRVAFWQELVSDTADRFDGVTVTFSTDADQSLSDVLERLQEQYPFRWRIESNVIVIQASDLAQLKDNPLDAKVKPFQYTGGLHDLIYYLNKEAPGLWAFTASDSELPFVREYHLSFDSEVTVRAVLSTVTRDYGVRWYVAIKPKLEHRVLRIEGDPRDIDVFQRVDMKIMPGPLPKLIK